MKHELVQSGKSFKHLKPLMDNILKVRYTDLAKQLEFSNQLLQISEEENYNYGKAFAYTYLGDYYIAHNSGNVAGEYLLKANELCENKNYNELLMNINIFQGIYYDMMLDRLMSLNCTMEALELATKLNNMSRRSIILNNIANMFETFGDLEAAKNYYYEAFSCLQGSDDIEKNSSHYALVCANLVHLTCRFNDLDEACRILDEFNYIDINTLDNLAQYIISCCHIASVKNDLSTICTYVEQLESLIAKCELWRYQYFEIMLHVARITIEFKNQEYSYRALLALSELTDDEDKGNQLREQRLWVQYYEMFGTDTQKGIAYQRYYQLNEIIDVTNNKTMSAGLHAKISLREAEKKQKEILKTVEKFENEAQCDELTQLNNRRSLVNVSSRVAGNPKVQTLGIIMIDVDYFKQFNDTYGHADGDVALLTVAKCMIKAAKDNPNISNFRYGGDEFLTTYENCSNYDIENFIKELIELVHNEAIPHCQSICNNIVSLSVGFHIIERENGQDLDIADLLAKADKALYWTKGQGRDGYSKYNIGMEIAWKKKS